MQFNIFKIKNKNELKKNMFEKNYYKKGNEIISGKFKLNLYCKYDNDLKLSWKNIFIEFGELNTPDRTSISGIIICESEINDYAITYGTSSFLVQKYANRDFGFDFAKRIELNELKRKSSINPHSTKNSSITSFKNTKTILYDSGENITSLSFVPLNKFYGKRIDIGKSIKFNINISLKNLHQLLEQIEKDMENNIINNIPLLTKITDNEKTKLYDEKMYEILNKEFDIYEHANSSNFTMNEFNIIGSSIYFEEEHEQIVKVGKYEKDIELHNLKDLFDLSKDIGVDIKTIIEKGKIIYKNISNERIYSESLKTLINFEIDNENASFYNGEWYYYNNDYYDLVMNEIDTIEVKYNPLDDCRIEELEKMKTHKNEYRELILNKVLQKKYNGILLDREMFISKYENEHFNSTYKIEIADLLLDNEYISIKIGNAQTLSYCVDQSELSAKLIDAKKIDLEKEGYPNPDKFCIWLFIKNKNIFDNNSVNIKKLNSIMLLSKICTWSKNIKLWGKTPIIRINKYND